MSIRLFHHLFIITIMLKGAIAKIQHAEQDFNRREALVRTIINAEKQAKTTERIRFLLECKRASVFPRFITNSVRNVSSMYMNSSVVEKQRHAFCRQLLNQSIKEAFRTQAYRERERKRLHREVAHHPRQALVRHLATQVYEDTIITSASRLRKKFFSLSQLHNRSVTKGRYPYGSAGDEDRENEINEANDANEANVTSKADEANEDEEAEGADETEKAEDADELPSRARAAHETISQLLSDGDKQDQHLELWYDCRCEEDSRPVDETSRRPLSTGDRSQSAELWYDCHSVDSIINETTRRRPSAGDSIQPAEMRHDCLSGEDNGPAAETICCRAMTAGDLSVPAELWYDCHSEWDFRSAPQSADTKTVRVTLAWNIDDRDSAGEICPKLAVSSDGREEVFPAAAGNDEQDPTLRHAGTDGDWDVWYDCLSESSFPP